MEGTPESILSRGSGEGPSRQGPVWRSEGWTRVVAFRAGGAGECPGPGKDLGPECEAHQRTACCPAAQASGAIHRRRRREVRLEGNKGTHLQTTLRS